MSNITVGATVDLDDYGDEVIEYVDSQVSFSDLGGTTKAEAEDWVRDQYAPDEFYGEEYLLNWMFQNVDREEIIARLEAELKPEQ